MGGTWGGCESRHRWVLLALVLVACVIRLYRIGEPLNDQLHSKQVHVANKARNVAWPTFDPFRSRLDFLDEAGQQRMLAEEIPLYVGMLGAGYHALGEQEWLGRALNIVATAVAILALFALGRREFDADIALVGAFVFAFMPLLIFWGRAVTTDVWMLAFMLLTALAYRRYLDGEGTRWLIATVVAGLVAAMFKYYGLMIVVVLGEMAARGRGWRGWLRPSFPLMVGAMTAPILIWVAVVFVPNRNPTVDNIYFVFKEPGSLLEGRLYECLFRRFLFNDCGPVALPLIVLGMWGVIRGRLPRGPSGRPLLGWTLMGLGWFFLCAPKLKDHDYYELMMLPAAAWCGALGWKVLCDRLARASEAGARRIRWCGCAIAAAATVVHSPLLLDTRFRPERGTLILAERLQALCPPGGRYVVMGHPFPYVVVHYSGRAAWTNLATQLEPDWERQLWEYRKLGADYVVLFFDPLVLPEDRDTFAPLRRALPEVEHREGPWYRDGKPCEYTILDLRHARLASWPAVEEGKAMGLGIAAGDGVTRR